MSESGPLEDEVCKSQPMAANSDHPLPACPTANCCFPSPPRGGRQRLPKSCGAIFPEEIEKIRLSVKEFLYNCPAFLNHGERCNLFPDGKPFRHSFVGASVSSDGPVTFEPGGRAAHGAPSSPSLFRPRMGSCRCFFEAGSYRNSRRTQINLFSP